MDIKINKKSAMKMADFLFSKRKKTKLKKTGEKFWQIHVFEQNLPILLHLFFRYYKLYMKYDR